MQYPSYPFDESEDLTQFFFDSVGPKGVIPKVVVFTPTVRSGVYNLGFGDYDSATDDFDDESVSDHDDTAKILATLVQVIHLFLTSHPNRRVIFSGNATSRNRLYRMAINRAYPELSALFSLFGYRNGAWENFETDRAYDIYLIVGK